MILTEWTKQKKIHASGIYDRARTEAAVDEEGNETCPPATHRCEMFSKRIPSFLVGPPPYIVTRYDFLNHNKLRYRLFSTPLAPMT